MKAQLVKTFIKAVAIVALATSIANCGAMPEESITETIYQPSAQPVDPALDPERDDDAVLIIDNCESWGLGFCISRPEDASFSRPRDQLSGPGGSLRLLTRKTGDRRISAL